MSDSGSNQRERPLWVRLPGLGSLIEIASDYATEGAAEYFERIAPLNAWIRTLGWPMAASLLLAAVPYPCGCMPYVFKVTAQPNDVALTLLPSLLGFGIGAYALVFALSGSILRKMQEGYERIHASTGRTCGSVLNINSAFAFPLSLMAITTLVAITQKILPEVQVLSSVTWFLTFLSLTLTYQLIVSLYRLGRVIILDKFSTESSGEHTNAAPLH